MQFVTVTKTTDANGYLTYSFPQPIGGVLVGTNTPLAGLDTGIISASAQVTGANSVKVRVWVTGADWTIKPASKKPVAITLIGLDPVVVPPPPPSGDATPPANPAFKTSDPEGSWSPVENWELKNNMWNGDATKLGSQTFWADSISSFGCTATMKAGNTAVETYPNAQRLFYDTNEVDPKVTSFKAITSSWAQIQPMNVAGYIGEAAYDIWLNSWAIEVMIWVENHGQEPAGNKLASPTIGGTTFDFYKDGSDYLAFIQKNAASGSVDILAVLKWLQANGHVPATAGLTAVDFGWEICSTGGNPLNFKVTDYKLNVS